MPQVLPSGRTDLWRQALFLSNMPEPDIFQSTGSQTVADDEEGPENQEKTGWWRRYVPTLPLEAEKYALENLPATSFSCNGGKLHFVGHFRQADWDSYLNAGTHIYCGAKTRRGPRVSVKTYTTQAGVGCMEDCPPARGLLQANENRC